MVRLSAKLADKKFHILQKDSQGLYIQLTPNQKLRKFKAFYEDAFVPGMEVKVKPSNIGDEFRLVEPLSSPSTFQIWKLEPTLTVQDMHHPSLFAFEGHRASSLLRRT